MAQKTKRGTKPQITLAQMERELTRMADERQELFGRLAMVESERTAQIMELFTMAAHELQTPYQSLMLGTELMLKRAEGSADEIPREWIVGHLRRQQGTLGRIEQLVKSWLLAPKLHAGTLAVVNERIDLAEVVRTVVARYESDLAWAGCSVELAVTSVTGSWDRTRLETIFMNVFSNALKYGAGKPIFVSVAASDVGASIAVRDQGVGISIADQERIFERFERGSEPPRVPGFGVGLWMARALLRSIGGTIAVQSAPGKGATFTIQLPQGTK
jgi:signal transduction histidine kinase